MTFKDWFTQDHDRELGTHIKDATQFSLSDKERNETRAHLLEYARMRPVRVRERASQRPTRSWLAFGLHPFPVVAILLVVAIGSGTAGAASLAQNALPGDILYGIKINVNEEVRAALASTPQTKAEVAIARAETRIKEIETLKNRGATINNETRTEVDARLDAQVHDAEEKTSLADDNSNEERLVKLLRAHETRIADVQIGGSGIDESELPPATTTTATTTHEMPQKKFVPSMPRKGTTADDTDETGSRDGDRKHGHDASSQSRFAARQQNAAQQRVESFEKLLDRSEARVSADAFAEAHAQLDDARAALDEGGALLEADALTDASVRFNAALRIAIDARELLAAATDEFKKQNKSRKTGTSTQETSISNDRNDNKDSKKSSGKSSSGSGKGGRDD